MLMRSQGKSLYCSRLFVIRQASTLKSPDLESEAQAAHVSSSGATVSAADSFHAVRPPGLEIKGRLAGIQVCLHLLSCAGADGLQLQHQSPLRPVKS